MIFKITSSQIKSYQATVEAEITTFDSNAILTAYQKELKNILRLHRQSSTVLRNDIIILWSFF